MNENQLKIILKLLHQECNTLYENYGATDEVISLQVAINSFRHKFNIVDDSEKIYDDFVQ